MAMMAAAKTAAGEDIDVGEQQQWWQMTWQRMTACKIGWRTMTEKVESGWQTTTALGTRL
jgi:hypothetical protein